MEQELITLLTERIRITKDDALYEPTQEELDAEVILYNEEQVALAIAQEVEAKTLAEARYENLVLPTIVIEAQDLTEMTSKQINDLCDSLEMQELVALEALRVEDVLARLDALNKQDVRNALIDLNMERPNYKAFRNRELMGRCKKNPLTNGDVEALLASIEVLVPSIKALRLAREAKANRKANGAMVRKLTNDVLDVIIGFNMETVADIDALLIKFGTINTLLSQYRPYTAKTAIQAIEVDADVTQQMKDEMLECYSN